MIKLINVAILCLSISACASHYGAAKIVSIPSGAEVINVDDGTTLGVTPTTVWWKDPSANRKHIALRFQKDGHYEKVSSFWLSMRHSTAAKAKKNATFVEVNLQKKGQD
jgi:hypothetical protein